MYSCCNSARGLPNHSHILLQIVNNYTIMNYLCFCDLHLVRLLRTMWYLIDEFEIATYFLLGVSRTRKEWSVARNRSVEVSYRSCWWGMFIWICTSPCMWCGVKILAFFKPFYLQGEDICDAAVREVKEETGVSNQDFCSFKFIDCTMLNTDVSNTVFVITDFAAADWHKFYGNTSIQVWRLLINWIFCTHSNCISAFFQVLGYTCHV